MARLFDGTQSLEVASASVTNYPVSISVLFNTDDITINEYLVALTAADGNFMALEVRGDIANDPLYAQTWNGIAARQALINGVTANTWHHGCALFINSTSRYVYLNGSSSSDAVESTISNVSNTTIADHYTGSRDFSGSIAEVGIWDVALTSSEVAILAKGYSPLLVRPQNLVMYVPLIRDNDKDLIGGLSFTAVNTPTIGIHPRVFYIAPPNISLLGEGNGEPPVLSKKSKIQLSISI